MTEGYALLEFESSQPALPFLQRARVLSVRVLFPAWGFRVGQLAVKFTAVETFPPAKLNLFLELLGKRADGYHELQTVMVAIDRCDALRVTRTEDPPAIELVCRWSPSAEAWRQRLPTAPPQTFSLPAAEDNLVVRAVQRFREVFGYEGGFAIWLEKRIPAGAGMGGASSDAASVLLAAAALCGVEGGDPRLADIAAELGSDIPFFLNPGNPPEPSANTAAGEWPARGERSNRATGMAFASGRGERLTPLPAPPRLHFVVVYPPEPLSTSQVFGQCYIPSEPRSAERWLDPLGGDPRGQLPQMFNRLTEPAQQMSGWIDQTLKSLQGVGLRGATMTGSGSACFALAGSARSARRAASILSARRLGVCFAATPTWLPATLGTTSAIHATG